MDSSEICLQLVKQSPQQKSATVRSLYLRTCSSVGGSSSTRRKTLARLHQPSGHERGGGVQLGQRKDEEEGSNYSSWSGVPCRGEGQRKCHGWIGFGCRWPTAAFRSQEGGLDAVLVPAINERHLDRARWITDDRKVYYIKKQCHIWLQFLEFAYQFFCL